MKMIESARMILQVTRKKLRNAYMQCPGTFHVLMDHAWKMRELRRDVITFRHVKDALVFLVGASWSETRL